MRLLALDDGNPTCLACIYSFFFFLDRKSGETNIFIAYNRLISHPSGCMILKVADVSDVSKVAVVSDVFVMF